VTVVCLGEGIRAVEVVLLVISELRRRSGGLRNGVVVRIFVVDQVRQVGIFVRGGVLCYQVWCGGFGGRESGDRRWCRFS